MDLVKNGTVTESCLPFSLKCERDKKEVEEYAKKYKDNSQLNPYYAKNAYILANYSENNSYQIFEFIINKLINEGHVYASIVLYDDFFT